jgi:hypothetical protein
MSHSSLAATLVAVACALYTTPLSLQQLLQRARSIHASLAATLVAARARARALYTRLCRCALYPPFSLQHMHFCATNFSIFFWSRQRVRSIDKSLAALLRRVTNSSAGRPWGSSVRETIVVLCGDHGMAYGRLRAALCSNAVMQ